MWYEYTYITYIIYIYIYIYTYNNIYIYNYVELYVYQWRTCVGRQSVGPEKSNLVNRFISAWWNYQVAGRIDNICEDDTYLVNWQYFDFGLRSVEQHFFASKALLAADPKSDVLKV